MNEDRLPNGWKIVKKLTIKETTTMASINKIFLLGNLTRDPELKEVGENQCVCDLGLAVNNDYTKKNGEKVEDVDFFDIAVWNNHGKACAKYLTKGRMVHVEGRMKRETWETEEGESRSRYRVIAQSVQFLPKSQKKD